MLTKLKSLATTAYNFTHVFVGAGAVVVSFLDTQQLPPKFAAGIVIVSQGLKVFSNWVDTAHTDAPAVLKDVEELIAEAKSVVVVPPKPTVASDG